MADRGFGRSDEANFINFCSGAELTNGRQIATGSCNGIPMVKIPAVTNMISAMIPGDEQLATHATSNVTHCITNRIPQSRIPSKPAFELLYSTTSARRGLQHYYDRICTMIVARNHGPVVMPAGQGGAQGDCTKFLVVERKQA
ncbi:hypothetical protein jhhlp_007937 [Lomentospora prolificans]|uniref:Uncharacterized protein n=1 Tax=Lomentospora prolificans TaxID=41688 RepID=A0A2N3N0Z6_9PEZI|nr:hypothetical protein jhhlp_007937 [Lomentospora prolificans]